jgi:phosphate acetyltransferase
MHTFLLVPTDFGVGLTSVSLGMVRALELAGLKVGFCKPIAQEYAGSSGPEHSTELIARTHGLKSPKPLDLAYVERRLSDGQLDELMEEIIHLHQQAALGHDVVIVEGLVLSPQTSFARQINLQVAKSLDADVIVVSAAEQESLKELFDRVEILMQLFGGTKAPNVLGVLLNKVRYPEAVESFARSLSGLPCLQDGAPMRVLGSIPWQKQLTAPRTRDVADMLGAQVLYAGDYEQRRVQSIILCARAVSNTVELFKPGVLVVTPGDRDDIIMAASLASVNGIPLAGLLLCGDYAPDRRIMELCHGALKTGLPVMLVASSSYNTATSLDRMNQEIPVDDRERAERVTAFVASHIDHEILRLRCGSPRETHLSPAAFRYQLVKRAQAANCRIVLPEGSEPRTIQAAAICQARGIARCVLLGNPAEVQSVAKALGIDLPEGLEILDPELIRKRYIAPMMELRKAKKLDALTAEGQLEDSVVLGTMMLALDEVDGLVSGAVHTTANTIRPALQLIKTAPEYELVSSLFFMLLPDQVVVYADCAVNPDPSAAELAEIALQTAESATAFGIEPRVAMISYSTGDSGSGSDVEKVREATRLARARRPSLLIDGPLQYDAAAIESVGKQKAPNSEVAGRATVFVFPDLNTGNTTYKAVQRSASCLSVGPMLQGLRKPVNDLSRGALVDDIVYTIALTAVQGAKLTKVIKEG